MAALAPMPRARVRATVIQSAGTRDRERMAIFRSCRNDIWVLHGILRQAFRRIFRWFGDFQ